jgi:uncharacterized protein
MVIDANVYWFLEDVFEDQNLAAQFLADAENAGAMSGRLRLDGAGAREIVMENPPGHANLNYRQGDYALDRQLADMDEAGVDVAVLKLPGCQQWLSLDLCRRFNDGMAEHVRRSDGRMVALACVPPDGGDAALDELRRCEQDLGMTGVQLSSHYGTDYLDAGRFTPFFDYLDERAATVYVHHSPTPVDDSSLRDFTNLRRSYGRCVDQATAIGREVFSGFFDRHPRLTFVHSMLGGALYSVLDLLLPADGPQRPDGRFAGGTADLRRALDEHVYVEMSHAQPWGATQLRTAIEVLGADHVVYGSSYPVRRAWLDGADVVRGLGLSARDEELVLGGNAARLYGAPAAAVVGAVPEGASS